MQYKLVVVLFPFWLWSCGGDLVVAFGWKHYKLFLVLFPFLPWPLGASRFWWIRSAWDQRCQVGNAGSKLYTQDQFGGLSSGQDQGKSILDIHDYVFIDRRDIKQDYGGNSGSPGFRICGSG